MLKITQCGGVREIESTEGYLRRKTSASHEQIRRSIMLDGESAADFEELTEAELTEAAKTAETEAAYEAEVERLIRQRYSVSAELAILRQRDTKPQEFAAYNAYAEECKTQARAAVAESEEDEE